MKWLLSLIFIVRVTIPFGATKTYEATNVQAWSDGFYRLVLTNDKVVYVPIMWTLVEEK